MMAPDVRAWLLTHGIRIVAVVLAIFLACESLRRTLPPALRHSLARGEESERRAEQLKRAETLSRVILETSVVALALVGAFLVLSEFGFNLAPVVAGLGITGIAVGLGAQSLVRDAINGLFILAENQFVRGDIVTIAGVTGRVEDVSLRRTMLRAEDGTLYIVPNSAISVAANRTRGFSGVSFQVGISYQADLEQAIEEIGRIGRDLSEDREFTALVLEAPRAVRVDSFEDTYLNLRIIGRVLPDSAERVTTEMLRRIKREFDRLGIAYRGWSKPVDGTGLDANGPPA